MSSLTNGEKCNEHSKNKEVPHDDDGRVCGIRHLMKWDDSKNENIQEMAALPYITLCLVIKVYPNNLVTIMPE